MAKNKYGEEGEVAKLRDRYNKEKDPKKKATLRTQLGEARAKAGLSGGTKSEGSDASVTDAAAASSTYREGSKTQGLNIGDAREIKGAAIAPTRTYDSAEIAKTASVQGPNLGPAAQISGANIDRSGDSPFRAQQLQLASDLQAAARGEGPSLSNLQLQQGLEKSLNANAAMIASQRGLSPGMAARLALRSQADMGQQTVAEAARQRVAEQVAARQQLSGLVTEGRTTELNTAAQQAQLQQDAAQGNQTATNTMAQQQGDLSLRASLANQQTDAARAQRQAELVTQARADAATAENARAFNQAQILQDAAKTNQAAVNQANLAQLNANAGVKQAQTSAAGQVGAAQASAYGNITSTQIAQEGANYRNDTQLAAGIGQNEGAANSSYDNAMTQAYGSAAQAQQNAINNGVTAANQAATQAATSDERAKKNIKDGDDAAKSFLDGLKARVFEYKSGKYGPAGPKVGIMAQDAERSDIGDQMVQEDEEGTKKIDVPQALSAALAGLANLNDRLKAMEGLRR